MKWETEIGIQTTVQDFRKRKIVEPEYRDGQREVRLQNVKNGSISFVLNWNIVTFVLTVFIFKFKQSKELLEKKKKGFRRH